MASAARGRALAACTITSDAYMACLTHALQTEREEVMGLLLGDIDTATNTSCILGMKVLQRSDKRPDRVEISPESLAEAASFAEAWSATLGRVIRVIGWYHSHPHITVHPSHVDLRTQAMYQQMDSSFVGLIFGVFNDDTSKLRSRVEVIAFQTDKIEHGPPSPRPATPQPQQTVQSSASRGAELDVRRKETKQALVPAAPGVVLALAFTATHTAGSTPNLRRDEPQRGRDEAFENSIQASLSAVGGLRPTEFVQLDIPLSVVAPLSGPDNYSSLAELQRILHDEEQATFKKAGGARSSSAPLSLQQIYCESVYTKSLCRLIDTSYVPLLLALEQRKAENQARIDMLRGSGGGGGLSVPATGAGAGGALPSSPRHHSGKPSSSKHLHTSKK